MKRSRSIFYLLCAGLILSSAGCTKDSAGEARLSPEYWPRGELQKYEDLNNTFGKPAACVEGQEGMVVGTTGALAVRAGLEALRQGGSAADAAMTTALTQICLAAGSWVSYAGIMTMVYYDAEEDRIHSMFAGFNTIQEEKDPLTIPKMGGSGGRTALVPGFLAGVQAVHDRFGKVPFGQLFEPAIYFAENGILVNPMIAGMIGYRKKALSRFPETKRIFTREEGGFYANGDTLRQPKLAATLRQIAVQGAGYIYRGEWARKFVDAVRADGGKVTLKDMEDYSVIWNEPLQSPYKGYDVYSLGAPSIGGVNTLEALNLMEVSRLSDLGHYTESAEGLFRFIQVAGLPFLLHGYYGVNHQNLFPGISSDPASRLSKEHAEKVWGKIAGSDWAEVREALLKDMMDAYGADESEGEKKMNSDHSDAIVAVDRHGNVAAVCHSINTASWGTTGIFVDGISIPDSACFQQQLIKEVGPGKPLPDPTNPLIVFKDGKPFLASSSIGSDLHACTLQNLNNILDFDMDPETSVAKANFHLFSANPKKRSVTKGDFSESIIEEVKGLGGELLVVSKQAARSFLGYWVGIRIDPGSGELEGGVSEELNGLAIGY